MRPPVLSALAAALVFAPAADACFLKCFRLCRTDRGPYPVDTVTIVSIDGQTPVFNPATGRYELPNPVPNNKVLRMLVRTNFDPGSANYFVATSCLVKAAKPVATTRGGYTDYDRLMDIGPFGPGQRCSAQVTVSGVASEPVDFNVSP